jgi:hypothetical protein
LISAHFSRTDGFTASLLMGLLFGAVIWIGAPLAERLLGVTGVAPVLRVLAWTFPIQGIGTVARSLVSRDLGFKWLANVDVTAYAVGYGVVGIGGAVLGYGVWSLVAAHMVESVVRSGLLLVRHPPTRRLGMERAALQDLLYFGSGFTLAALANYVAVQGDQALTGRYLGAASLGFYGRAHALMAAPAYAFGTVLDQVLFPAMAKVQHDPERLAAVYRRGVALIALLVLPASAVLILVAPELVRVVLGPRWAPVVAPFQVLGTDAVPGELQEARLDRAVDRRRRPPRRAPARVRGAGVPRGMDRCPLGHHRRRMGIARGADGELPADGPAVARCGAHDLARGLDGAPTGRPADAGLGPWPRSRPGADSSRRRSSCSAAGTALTAGVLRCGGSRPVPGTDGRWMWSTLAVRQPIRRRKTAAATGAGAPDGEQTVVASASLADGLTNQ